MWWVALLTPSPAAQRLSQQARKSYTSPRTPSATSGTTHSPAAATGPGPMVLDSQRDRPAQGQYNRTPGQYSLPGQDSSAAPRGQYTEMTQRSYPSGAGQTKPDAALVDQYSGTSTAGAAGVPIGGAAGATEVNQGNIPAGAGTEEPSGDPADGAETEGHYVRGPNGQFVDWVGPHPDAGSSADKHGQHKGLGAKMKGMFGHSHGGKQE